MSKKKKYKKKENKYFYTAISGIIVIIVIFLSLISIYVLDSIVVVNQQKVETNKKKNEVDKENIEQKDAKENYYKPKISEDVPSEYKEDFINACDFSGIDVESVSDFQKIDNWEYGELFSFIYNGGDYKTHTSNSGEIVKIEDAFSNILYENKNAELVKNEDGETDVPGESNDYISKPEVDKKNIYNPDDNIEKLIAEYNQISEFKIGENNIRQGAYDFSACASCNGVWIMIYDSTKMYVDFSVDAYNDSQIYPVFRDFCKVLNKNLTDEEILAGWNELQTGKYKAYNYYYIGGIQCSYIGFRPEIGAMTQYTIKIGAEY